MVVRAKFRKYVIIVAIPAPTIAKLNMYTKI
jgi:hypothetical protein